MGLQKVRKAIDAIDDQIMQLLNCRAKEVLRVNALKEKNKLDIYAPQREAAILARLKRIKSSSLSAEDIEIIFREIFSVFRSLQNPVRVVYLGPEGTFTQAAAMKQFGKRAAYRAVATISDVFDEVERAETDYGVVPIENSIEGVINYTLDVFFDSPLKICAEVTLPISHALLARRGVTIKRIYSKLEVFPQCRRWLNQHYPHVELVPASSTAKAAILANGDRYGACIGHKSLAALYDLHIIASSIEDAAHNVTRFLVIAKNDSFASGNDKTSVLFSVKDRVGVLYDVLASFKQYKINLTKIESRPSKKKPWEYYFFVDFLGHRSSPRVEKALRALARHCVFLKILGSYPKER
ncbi:MAG: prephenate dehydratase [Candidatus Omnitrophota bacterium]|nr:prephenate dehydratase [Candidatus Omnitrophota bacterium]